MATSLLSKRAAAAVEERRGVTATAAVVVVVVVGHLGATPSRLESESVSVTTAPRLLTDRTRRYRHRRHLWTARETHDPPT
jgi:hypothetical protein